MGDSVEVLVRHWWQDKVVMICLLQFVFALLMGIQEAITAHTLSASAVWSAVISAFIAVVKARAPEVVTGLRLLDKPQKEGQ